MAGAQNEPRACSVCVVFVYVFSDFHFKFSTYKQHTHICHHRHYSLQESVLYIYVCVCVQNVFSLLVDVSKSPLLQCHCFLWRLRLFRFCLSEGRSLRVIMYIYHQKMYTKPAECVLDAQAYRQATQHIDAHSKMVKKNGNGNGLKEK